eukprot:m.425791 g.425791  ORF g.425791 m.425791 type:complete len:73 (-) comp54510_c0_seq1:409-627(-)
MGWVKEVHVHQQMTELGLGTLVGLVAFWAVWQGTCHTHHTTTLTHAHAPPPSDDDSWTRRMEHCIILGCGGG